MERLTAVIDELDYDVAWDALEREGGIYSSPLKVSPAKPGSPPGTPGVQIDGEPADVVEFVMRVSDMSLAEALAACNVRIVAA